MTGPPDDQDRASATGRDFPSTEAPGRPQLTTGWYIAKLLTIFALIAWFVAGCGLGSLMLMALSLEGGGGDTGHRAQATQIMGWWIVGLVVGIVVLRLIVTKGRRRLPDR